MIYGYIRVSTDKQTVENQKYEINAFCKKNNLVIAQWIEETISGTKKVSERKLDKLIKKMKKDDVMICSELSRLGRNLLMIMGILNECMNRDIQIWTIKDNYQLGSDINSKVLAFAFGLSAEIERNLISQRTREALARKKSEGKILGRPKGIRCRLNPKCVSKHLWIISQLEAGTAKQKIAKKLKISATTLYRYLIYTDCFIPTNCQREDWKARRIYT